MKIFCLLLFVGFGSGNSKDLVDPEKHPNWKLLPHDKCGEESGERNSKGSVAPIYAHPWLVAIGYRDGANGVNFACDGSIVNSKTILTAAHCLFFSQVVKVRVGELDFLTDPDCEGSVCADPVVDHDVLEVLYFKKFSQESFFSHDIGLIRLKDEIKFTDFVKPICIPTKKLIEKDLIDTPGELASWENFNPTTTPATDLSKLLKPDFLKNTLCTLYSAPYNRFDKTQLCEVEKFEEEVCQGLPGGPLVQESDETGTPKVYVMGITSYSIIQCGNKHAVNTFTRFSTHVGWLLDNLQETQSSSINP